MSFEIGDKVKITGKTHGHRFNIGEIVTLVYVTPYNNKNYILQAAKNGVVWAFTQDECEKVVSNPGVDCVF